MFSEDFCVLEQFGPQERENFSRSSMVFSPTQSSDKGGNAIDQKTEGAKADHHMNLSIDGSEDSEITEEPGLFNRAAGCGSSEKNRSTYEAIK